MKRIEYLIKHNRIIQFLYRLFFSTLFTIISFFVPVKNNLVLMSSFSGKKFNDSPKVLYDRMVENGFLDKYVIIWAFENPDLFKQFNLKTVKINSFKYFFVAFRAKYWITNVNIERGLRFKKRKQIYLNTWHGTGPKTIGNAATGRKDYNFKKVNYLCADGVFLKDIFIKNFNAKPDNIILCGRPREDILYHPNGAIKEKIQQKYGLSNKDFILLYAPTWREPKKKSEKSVFDITLDIEKILKTFPDAKVLFRAHSITSEVKSNLEFNNRFISVTDEPDIGDLFFVTDVLITDYSSSNLDIAILKKPFICFAPDYEDYIKNRSLCYDLKEEYPFGVQYDTSAVIDVLKRIKSGDNKLVELEAFKKKYGPYGGDATEICLSKLFGQSN